MLCPISSLPLFSPRSFPPQTCWTLRFLLGSLLESLFLRFFVLSALSSLAEVGANEISSFVELCFWLRSRSSAKPCMSRLREARVAAAPPVPASTEGASLVRNALKLSAACGVDRLRAAMTARWSGAGRTAEFILAASLAFRGKAQETSTENAISNRKSWLDS